MPLHVCFTMSILVCVCVHHSVHVCAFTTPVHVCVCACVFTTHVQMCLFHHSELFQNSHWNNFSWFACTHWRSVNVQLMFNSQMSGKTNIYFQLHSDMKHQIFSKQWSITSKIVEKAYSRLIEIPNWMTFLSGSGSRQVVNWLVSVASRPRIMASLQHAIYCSLFHWNFQREYMRDCHLIHRGAVKPYPAMGLGVNCIKLKFFVSPQFNQCISLYQVHVHLDHYVLC